MPDIQAIMVLSSAAVLVSLGVAVALWRQARGMYRGTGLLALDFVAQACAFALLLARGVAPDLVSIVGGNTLVFAGSVLGLEGLRRFLGVRGTPAHNWAALVVYVAIHAYFTFVRPDLDARNLNIAIGLGFVWVQCAWVALFRVRRELRVLSRGVGLVFVGYCVVNVARVVEWALRPGQGDADFLQAGTFDRVVLLAYQVLVLALTYSLVLMVNRRLILDAAAERAKYVAAFRSSPWALVLTRLSDGKIVEVNDSFVAMSGYANVEAVGRTTLELGLWPREEDRATLVAELEKSGRIAGAAIGFRTRSGPMLSGLVSSEVIDLDGEPHMLSAIADVTHLAEVEAALASERDRLRAVLATAPVAIVVADSAGRASQANRAAELLFGASSGDGADLCRDVLRCEPGTARAESSGDAARCAGCAVTEALGGGRVAGREVELPARGGAPERRLHLLVHAEPVEVDGGHAAVLAFQDISELRQAQRDREALQARLAQADRLASMGLLAAGVAHEINNPLSYVLYNLQSLADELPAHAGRLAEARREIERAMGGVPLLEAVGPSAAALDPEVCAAVEERFREALAGATKIKVIARGLGTFARVERDELAPVELARAAEAAATIAFNQLKHRARLVKDLGATAPVLGSEGRLSQVFLNLLINAAQAIPEGQAEQHQVTIRTWQEGDTVCGEVADTGHGIRPEHRDRLFEPFFTTKAVGEGSGLGLSIVRTIVTGFGGTIAVESEVGRGTRFTVRFPAVAPPAGVPSRPAPAAAPEPRPAGRVLVVDDEPGIRRALKRILREHEVVEAASGREAIAVLTADQGFDAILCDVMMPDTSGIEVHRWLAGAHPGLAARLVFVSGGAFTPATRAYLETLDNRRVDKPFEAAAVRGVVEALLAEPATAP